MDKVRIGIVGMGNMGKYHADYLLKGEVAHAELAAVCSTSPHKLEAYKDKVKVFSDGEAMIKSGEIDAVLVATPHYQHTSLGICAIEHQVHLMVEKPISAHKADAEKLIAVAEKHPAIVFGAMFQLRTEPRYLKLKKLIQDGDLGEIVRINWIITDWYRTEAYYASGGWRATWKGEGGGVLLNQCLHQLDALQWLVGMPSKVRSFAQLGRFHNIEVEDNVTAYLEYPNGATGVFISSTGEAPGSNRFEIAGTRGKVILENDQIQFTRNENCMLEHSKQSKIGFSKPEIWNVAIPFGNAVLPHAILMRNFINAIRDGEPLIAPGADGIHSVELANALLYSSLIDQTIDMPMDGAAFETKLNQLIRESTFEKKVVEVSDEDFASSFNR
ncbi:MAG: Gfo/Idh/MocA family oxidoreductase [Verrucomicrobia bacterium]|jgi:predicted dehydrogenase|nr:Gfo/Idh/MocA family oxidoreductase [Verrucomicrobiota bacterium]